MGHTQHLTAYAATLKLEWPIPLILEPQPTPSQWPPETAGKIQRYYYFAHHEPTEPVHIVYMNGVYRLHPGLNRTIGSILAGRTAIDAIVHALTLPQHPNLTLHGITSSAAKPEPYPQWREAVKQYWNKQFEHTRVIIDHVVIDPDTPIKQTLAFKTSRGLFETVQALCKYKHGQQNTNRN